MKDFNTNTTSAKYYTGAPVRSAIDNIAQNSNSWGAPLVKKKVPYKYPEALETIKAMGFEDEAKIKYALEKDEGKVELALDKLMNGVYDEHFENLRK